MAFIMKLHISLLLTDHGVALKISRSSRSLNTVSCHVRIFEFIQVEMDDQEGVGVGEIGAREE